MLYLLFIIQLILLFFLSKKTTNEIFYFFRAFHIEEKTIFAIVSLLFLPGTIIHELAHFFAAMILFMKVRELKIFPEFQENEIKLGHVLYEKKDFIRGILVGIAPFFAGAFFFWMIAYFKLFPNQNIAVTILLAYLIFAVSSTMFSSKQDLVDIVYVIPVMILIGGVWYVFGIQIDWITKNEIIIKNITQFLKQVDFYFFYSLMINIALIAGLKTVKKCIV